MELNQFAKTMTDLCGGIAPENIMAALTGPDRETILQAYRDQVGTLEYDHLRECWEYWFHKKDSGQFFTPPSLCKLAAAMTDCGGSVVMDICAGSGSLTIAKWVQKPDRFFICFEKDRDLVPYLLFNLCVRRMKAYVRVGDALGEMEEAWKVEPDQAPIRTDEKPVAAEPIEVVSNPPYNMKWSGEAPPLSGWPRIPKGNANYAFIMTCLVGTRAAVILPSSVLWGNPDKEAREWLICSGCLEHVIQLPENMFENTSIKTCMFILSQNNISVRFTDLSESQATETRDRNGMYGGASHERRTYHKTFATITDEQIEELKKPEGRYVPIATIGENDWDLKPERYEPMEPIRRPHRPMKDIMADLNRISKEKSLVKVTINETYAKQYGIPAELFKSEEEAANAMKELFENLGGEYFYRRYVTVTKSRELKIEANDKEQWSHLFKFWLQQWAEHVHYCNSEENRLLAEMRNAVMDIIFGDDDSEEANEVRKAMGLMGESDDQKGAHQEVR